MKNQRDILVIGAGPAGLAIARACARQKLNVGIAAPDIHKPWEQTYGVWVDELANTPYANFFEYTWKHPKVWTGPTAQHLDRVYGLLNVPKLQRWLVNEINQSDITVFTGTVKDVIHHTDDSEVLFMNGSSTRARIVIDASGGSSQFITRKHQPQGSFQIAYGQVVHVDSHPFKDGEMSFMDFREVPGIDTGPPTFLYALPLAPNRIFVEETSLVSQPPMEMDELKARLEKRLLALDIRPKAVLSEEFCRIPMGLNLPRKNQRILGYGSAASMVHPASGFHIAHALTLAPAVAESIAVNFHRSLDQTVSLAWDAIWPTERIRTWELYDFGKDFLTTLTPEQTRTFFSAFFQLSDREWQGYMSANLSVSELANVMMGVFSRLNTRMRWELIRTGMSLRSFSLLRAALSR